MKFMASHRIFGPERNSEFLIKIQPAQYPEAQAQLILNLDRENPVVRFVGDAQEKVEAYASLPDAYEEQPRLLFQNPSIQKGNGDFQVIAAMAVTRKMFVGETARAIGEGHFLGKTFELGAADWKDQSFQAQTDMRGLLSLKIPLHQPTISRILLALESRELDASRVYYLIDLSLPAGQLITAEQAATLLGSSLALRNLEENVK